MAKKINDNPENEATIDILEQAKNINQQTHNYIDWNQKTGHMLSDKSFGDTETLENDWGSFGQSSHDNTSFNPNYKSGDLNEMRAADQGFAEKIGLGAAKMTTTAATTFLDNTVGFLWGIAEAGINGNASRIFDNDFTNAMQDFNDYIEKEMPHYSSQYEGWGMDFWGNFIGKDILQNAGFQIGTGLSMIVPGGILKGGANVAKGVKALSNFMKTGKAIRTGNAAKDLVMGTYAAIGESTIEALNNKRDFVKYQTKLMNDEFAQQNQVLDDQWKQLVLTKYNGNKEAARSSMDFNEYFNQKQLLERQKQERQKFITQEADKVGDMTFLANLVICGGTNFLTFGKSFWGYNQSKRFSDGMATDIVEKGTNNVLKKNLSESTAKKAIKEGFIEIKNPNYGKMVQNTEGKWVKDTQKTIKKAVETNTRAVSKSPLANTLRTFAEEGNQEMIQQVSSDYSTDIAETDMLNFEALAKDGLAYDEILKRLNDTWFDYGKMCQAFKKVYTDPQQWRQFFGGAIGVGFSPHFTKGADGKLKFHLNNIGAQNAAIREQNSINALIAEDINKIINSPESQNYLTGLLRHTALDRVKQNAVTADDKMEYENADFAQFVSDITTLSNAGKLEFLSAHLEGMRNMEDEDLKKTCMNMCTTNKNGKVVGDFVDTNGNFIGDSEDGMRKVREKLNRRIDRLQKDISLYQRTMNEIDGQTNGVLDHETLAAFTWEKAQLMNKYARAKEIIGGEKSVKNLGIYKNKITANLTDFTNKLNSTKESLKQEKERLSRVPKVEGKPVEASELQKQYEADIDNLTRQINIATEVSQLLTDMEALQVNNSDHNDDKSAIQQLFDKYSDMIGKMPEFAKMQGLVDENGNRIKKKNKKGEVIKNEDGTDKVASLSLEDIMATGLFDKVMQEYADVDSETVNDMSGDYADAAKLHFRAKETEKGLDELVRNPEQFTAHRAALQQRILERENDKTITKLTKAIQKGIDEGRITLDNLEEESKKIAEAIENDETTKTRRLFDRMVSSLNTTPYDELRKIAINRVLKDKKNKDFAQIRDLINYVYLNVVMNNNLSDKAKEIAMQAFNNAIKGKKNIEEIHNTKITINDVNVNSLLVEESAGDKLLKRQRIERGEQNLPYNSANYIYTEKSYAEAKIAQNEIPQIINSAVDKFYNSRNSSKLSDQLGNIDESAVNAGTESAKVKKDIADKKKAVEDKINELLKTFKDGEVLSEAEKDKLVDDVNKIIDKALNDEEYKEEYRQEVSDANIELKRLAIDLIEKNVLNRISDNYKKQDKDIEAEVYLDKAIDAVNKKIQKIQRELERKGNDNEAFNDVFDDIAKDDSSEEPKNSIEGYYYENGNVYRGHFVPCNSLLAGRKCYAVAERIDKNRYYWKIIDNHGAVIGTIYTNELLEPKKRGGSISFDFSNLVTFTPDAFSLQRFSQLGILVEPKPTTNAENRKRKAKRKKVNQVFRDNGTIDDKGNVNLQNNLIQSVITSNVIFDNDLTNSQENQVISSANILTSPVELTPTTIQSAENLTPTTIESADNLTPTTIERIDYNAPNLIEEEKTQLQSVSQKQIQARRTVSRLDSQLSELNNMLNRLQDAAKQNPTYHETLRTVDTFKQYVEFVRSNYEALGKPRNVVLDSNAVQTIMDNLRNNMRKIFGDDVTFANDADMQRLADEAQKMQYSRKYKIKSDTILTNLSEKYHSKPNNFAIARDLNNLYICDYNGTEYTILRSIRIEGNEDLLNELENEINNGTIGDTESFNRRLQDIKTEQGRHNSDNVNVENIRPTDDNDRLSAKASERKNNEGETDSNGNSNQRTSQLTELSTSDNEIYGFTSSGNVVINKDKFSLDTPVHEYTHIWDKACMEHSPELWKRGVELMKQTDEWQKVLDDPNYANIKDDVDKVASEVHSRLSGMLAAGKAIQFAGRKNNKGFWAKLLNWFKEFKDFTLRHVFGMSKEDAQKVTLQQFLSAPVADFFMQTDPRNIGITDYVKPKATQKTTTTNKEHKVKVGDTVQYQGVAKKATVTSVSDKCISIKTEDGKEYKNVDAKYIDFLYGSKPSSNAKYSDIEKEDAVSPEEYIARQLVGTKINDVQNEITDLKIASKKGETIDKIVLDIKDKIPFNISEDEIKNHIIDITSDRTIDAIKQYAVDSHYEAEDKAWEAERSRIESELEGGINHIITNEEDISEAEYADWLDSPFEEDALRYELDRQFAEEESERTYNDVQYSLAQEAALAEQSGFDPIALFVEEELARLKQQVPPVKLDIVNDDADTKLARESENNAKAEIQSEPIDTFKPGISEFNINDKTQTFINPKNEKGFRYIYDLYKATGAFDYVKNGNLRAGDEVQIAYGKIGENAETNKPIYGVVFLVKDNNGNYQMIGTMSETKKSDPQTAAVLRQELDKLAKDSKNYQIVSVNNNNSTNTFGSSNISFKLMLNNGKPITTTISKVLNGSLLNSQTRHSLKDVILPNGVTVGNAVKNGENNLAIAFYDSKLQSVGNANFTVDDVQLEAMKAFKNKGSKHKGHVVLMVDKPDGRKQLIPLRVATLGDLINKPNNAIVNNIKEVIGKLYDIYSSKSTIGKKNRDMFEYLVMFDQYIYDSTKFGTKIYFNAGNAIAIEADNNDRIVLKNEDGSPISREDFENEVLKQLSSFFINVDERSLERPEILNSYIMNDVFTTYLVETTHRNSHFTVNPINAAGERLKVEKDTPEQKILKSYGIKEVIGTVGQTDLFDVVVVKDLKGNYGIYEKIGNTYQRSGAISNYSTIQQFCMVAYAKLKKGIEADTYNLLSNGYTKDLNGKLQGPKELLVHKTELGDTYIYDTESFNRIDNNNVYTVDNKGNEHNFVTDKVETKSDKDLSLDSKKVQNTLDKGKKAAKPKKQVKSSIELPALFFAKDFANTLLSLPTPKAITQFFESVDMQDFVDEINGNESIVGPYKRMVEFLKSNLSKEQLEAMVDTLKEFNNNVFEVYTNYIKSQSQNLGVSIDEALSSSGLFKLIESTKKPDNIKTAFEKEDETCAI